jgi:hypothetical protein
MGDGLSVGDELRPRWVASPLVNAGSCTAGRVAAGRTGETGFAPPAVTEDADESRPVLGRTTAFVILSWTHSKPPSSCAGSFDHDDVKPARQERTHRIQVPSSYWQQAISLRVSGM